jgi:signal peptidase II
LRAPVAQFVCLALATTALDQATKLLVVSRMALGESIPVLGPVMSLTRQANTGAFFSLFASAGGLLAVVGVVLVAVLLFWGWRAGNRHPELILPLGLVLGGAMGNLIDRLARGEVVDFLDFHFWPVFNVADIALTAGVLLAILRLLRCPPGQGAPPKVGR